MAAGRWPPDPLVAAEPRLVPVLLYAVTVTPASGVPVAASVTVPEILPADCASARPDNAPSTTASTSSVFAQMPLSNRWLDRAAHA